MYYGQQPQYGAPQQNFGVPGMVPGMSGMMGAPQTNMMGAMGYGATPGGATLQYDPGLTSTVIQHIQVMIQSMQVAQPIAKMLMDNINFQSGQPQVIQNVNKMMMQTMRNLQQMGVDMSGRTPVRDEAIQQALRPWLNNSLTILFNTYQQQQGAMMGGYGQGQPQMYAQPQMGMGYPTPQQSLYNVQPPSFQSPYAPQSQAQRAPGLYNTGVKPAPQPNFGSPGAQPQPGPAQPMYQPNAQAPQQVQTPQVGTPVEITPITPPPVRFEFIAEPDAELPDQLFSVGYKLLNDEVHTTQVGDVKATATAIESGFTANSGDEALAFFSANAPESLYDEGEFMHALHYKQVKALPVATETFIKFRDQFIASHDKNWARLLTILDHTPRGVSIEIDKFMTDMINNALYARFRVESDILEKISIDSLYDIKELSDGKFGGALKQYPEWHERISDILNRVIEQVFTQADFVKPEEKDLSDVVRCDGINVTVGKLTKYNLGFIDKDSHEALKTAIFADYTVLRFNRTVGVTNTLTDQDLKVDDLTPGNNSPGEILYWTMLETLVMRHHRPFDAMVFVRANSLQKSAVIEKRNRIFAMDVKKEHYLKTRS